MRPGELYLYKGVFSRETGEVEDVGWLFPSKVFVLEKEVLGGRHWVSFIGWPPYRARAGESPV